MPDADPITQESLNRIEGLLGRLGLPSDALPLDQYQRYEGGQGFAFTTSALVVIDGIAGPASHYAVLAHEPVDRGGPGHHWTVSEVHAILLALKADLEAGNLRGLQDRVRGDTFEDFLEMAAHLLNEGYEDAAAVITGSVLEGHLRALAVNRSIAVAKPDGSSVKSDGLNAELARLEAYSKGDQKSVTAWLDLRNDAAHGHYDRYAAEQVKLVHGGVRDFLNRVPA
jgi:hypothetical protein